MDFNLPDIGEGVAEGEVVKWLVKEGDRVTEDQPIVEVMTDKATVQIPSPAAGVIQRIAAQEGEHVPVGKLLVVIATGAQAAGAASAAPPAPTPGPAARPSTPAAAAARAPAPALPVTPRAVAVAPAPVRAPEEKVLATPATRRLAQEMGIDLAQVAGTGPHGRVTREDVVQFGATGRGEERAPGAPAAAPVRVPLPAPAAPAAPAVPPAAPARAAAPTAAPGAREERIPFRGIRRKIAEHMTRSKHTAAHFTYVDEVDVTQLVALRRETKEIAEKRGVKLSYLPFVIKAVIAGLKEYPLLNATLDEAAGQVVLKRYYNIGVATDTPEGLIVPVVKDADQRSILDLGREVERLAEDARTGKSQLADLQGGTFTITSAGNIGGLFATPIINYPEVAILGVHQIKEKPVVKNGQIVIGQVMYLSISLDHRIVDGAVGGRFMNTVIKYLEEPKLLLLESA